MALMLIVHALAGWHLPVLASPITSGALAGLGGVGSPNTGNVDDMSWNPAALGETSHRIQFRVTPISVRIFTDRWSTETVARLLAGSLGPEKLPAAVEDVQEEGLNWTIGVGGGAHVAWGTNAFGATLRGHLEGAASADGTRLVLMGGEPGRSYLLEGTHAEGAVFGEGHMGSVYSDPWLAEVLHITGFHMGGTLCYIHGLGYAKAEVIGPTIEIAQDGDTYRKLGDGRIVATHSESGFGMSTNLGLLLRLTPGLAIDVSVTDVGRVWWRDIQETHFEFLVDPQTGKGAYEQSETRAVAGQPYWNMPMALRAGISLEPAPGVRWSLQYAKSLVGQQAGHQEIVLATQLTQLEVLPLRLGAKFSTYEESLSFSGGLGIHLGPLTLDVGSPNLVGLLGQGKEASVSVSTGLRF
jgi:hypothetical protein